MKKISITLFAAVMFIVATLKVSAQNEQTRQVSGFSAISSAGSFDIHVKIDGTESLKIAGEAAIVDKIETVVENGKLLIRFKEEFRDNNDDYKRNKINIYISAKSLSALSSTGSGYINVDGTVSGSTVKLTVTGSGSITTAVKAEDINTMLTGSGSLHINGSSTNAKYVITGSGSFDAKEFKTESAIVTIAGSGSAHINVDKTISASIAGSGSLTYSGNASVTQFRTAGSGSINKTK